MMPLTIRDLAHDDQEQVNDLCSTTWGGKDYVPGALQNWVDDSNVVVRGRFDGTHLVCICALEIQASRSAAYISGLRTRNGRRREGHGRSLVENLIDAARKLNVETLFYITGNENHASIELARSLGFALLDQVHFFNLYSPFPPHPSPNDLFKPHSVAPERLAEILQQYPLVSNQHLPYDYEFHPNSVESLVQISKTSDFWLVMDEDGDPGGFYYRDSPFDQGGERRVTYNVFTINRAVFIDMMARILDEILDLGVNRATFLMGQKAAEWAPFLGYTDSELSEWPGEHVDRCLQFYSRGTTTSI
jgi:N-acetylglutamate synthase-like GNAT family acetyltransferase